MRKRYLILAAVVGLALCVMLAQSLVAQGPAGGGRGGAGAGAGAPGAGAPGGGAPGGAPGGGQGRGAPGGAGGGGRGAAPEVPVVKGADGKPDFTGYYMGATTTNINSGRGGVILDDAGNKGAKIPYNTEWEAKAADTAKNHMFDEPYAHCLPAGVPTNFGIQMGFQIVQGKNTIVFAWDTVGGTRTIYLDDRKHIPASVKLYQGDSIGHWEGDVLVVDTTSIAAGWWDASGAIHSDQTHVVERFSWAPKAAPNEKELNGNRILYEATVEDPVALTKPWKMSDNFNRISADRYPNSWGKRPTGYEQTETACVEGDMDMALYPVSSGGFSKDSTTGPSAAGVVPGAAGGGRGGGGGAGGGRGGAGRGAPGGGAAGAGAPAGGQQ